MTIWVVTRTEDSTFSVLALRILNKNDTLSSAEAPSVSKRRENREKWEKTGKYLKLQNRGLAEDHGKGEKLSFSSPSQYPPRAFVSILPSSRALYFPSPHSQTSAEAERKWHIIPNDITVVNKLVRLFLTFTDWRKAVNAGKETSPAWELTKHAVKQAKIDSNSVALDYESTWSPGSLGLEI